MSFSRRFYGQAVAIWLLAALLSACGSDEALQFDAVVVDPPETQIAYRVETLGAPDAEIEDTIEAGLLLYQVQAKGAPSLAHLSRRAEQDLGTLDRILRSEGYYSSATTYRIEAGADAEGAAAVSLEIDPGPRFTIQAFEIVFTDPIAPLDPPGPDELELTAGAPAASAEIVAAEDRAIGYLHRRGRPYARRSDRQVTADFDSATLSVLVTLDPGPETLYGPLEFAGAETVETAYLESYRPWKEGEPLDGAQLVAYQRELSGTGLFDAVSVDIPKEAPAGPGPVTTPVTITVEERKPRSFGIGLRYATDHGPLARLSFEHRNLFGANEQLRAISDIGLTLQSLETTLRKPQFLRDGQDLTAGITLLREEDEAFDQLAATASLGLERELSPQLRVGVGGLVEAALTDDEGEEETSYLFGLPVFALYDDSDDLLDPTVGMRARIGATPFTGLFDNRETAFLVLDGTASTYWSLDDDSRVVLAVRGRLGSILGVERDRIPPQRRLYAGGGGSVRGYENRFIGPLDDSDDPEGGRSVIEAGIEMRMKVSENIGVVPFLDAGSVATEPFPDFGDGVQLAAGLGFRYFTPVGPLRLDVAVPLNPRDADDSFQFYISIGQAF